LRPTPTAGHHKPDNDDETHRAQLTRLGEVEHVLLSAADFAIGLQQTIALDRRYLAAC
jgi:hypothetical protein